MTATPYYEIIILNRKNIVNGFQLSLTTQPNSSLILPY